MKYVAFSCKYGENPHEIVYNALNNVNWRRKMNTHVPSSRRKTPPR